MSSKAIERQNTSAGANEDSKQESKNVSVEDYVDRASAESTKRAYKSDVAHYLKHGGTIPASPKDIALYLATWADRLSVATLERRLIALHQAHRAKGWPTPI